MSHADSKFFKKGEEVWLAVWGHGKKEDVVFHKCSCHTDEDVAMCKAILHHCVQALGTGERCRALFCPCNNISREK